MIDTLTIVFLAPMLTGAVTCALPTFPGDSSVITGTVEISAELVIGRTDTHSSRGEVVRIPEWVPKIPPVAYVAVDPGDAAVAATRWGFDGHSDHNIGYTSVTERKLTRGWMIRFGAIGGLFTRHEQEIRWSLAHGIF